MIRISGSSQICELLDQENTTQLQLGNQQVCVRPFADKKTIALWFEKEINGKWEEFLLGGEESDQFLINFLLTRLCEVLVEKKNAHNG